MGEAVDMTVWRSSGPYPQMGKTSRERIDIRECRLSDLAASFQYEFRPHESMSSTGSKLRNPQGQPREEPLFQRQNDRLPFSFVKRDPRVRGIPANFPFLVIMGDSIRENFLENP